MVRPVPDVLSLADRDSRSETDRVFVLCGCTQPGSRIVAYEATHLA